MSRASGWFQKVSDAGATKGRRVPTFAAGRVCAHPGCETPLSRYNAEAYCGLHQPDVTSAGDGAG